MSTIGLSEQIMNELMESSPDFVQDKNKVEQLLSLMLTHKPLIPQNPLFKTQLADNLQKHIVWSQETHAIDPKVEARTSWLGRMIAYGIPGLAMLAVVLYTVPRSPTQEIVPSSLSSDSALLSSGGGNPITQVVFHDLTQTTSQDTITSKIITPTSSSSSNTTVVAPISKEQTSPEEVQTPSTSPKISEGSSPVVGNAEDISIQVAADMRTSSISTPEDEVIVSQDSQTLVGRQSFVDIVSQSLDQKISLKEGTLLDCIQYDTDLTCAVLRDREFSKDNKIKFFNEITKNISSDKMNDEKRENILKELGL